MEKEYKSGIHNLICLISPNSASMMVSDRDGLKLFKFFPTIMKDLSLYSCSSYRIFPILISGPSFSL